MMNIVSGIALPFINCFWVKIESRLNFYLCLFLNVGTIDNPEEKRNVDAARSLLIITLSPSSSENYTQFHDKVRYFNEQPPFNFYNPFSAYQKVVSNLISISTFRNKCFNSTNMLHIQRMVQAGLD